MAAGVLMEKWLEGRHEQAPELRQEPTAFATGLFDHDSSIDSAARELEQRPIDMGSGNDWDDGDSGTTRGNSDGW